MHYLLGRLTASTLEFSAHRCLTIGVLLYRRSFLFQNFSNKLENKFQYDGNYCNLGKMKPISRLPFI